MNKDVTIIPNDPDLNGFSDLTVRVEHWTDDLSKDVAREIRCRCDIDGRDVPVHLDEFVGRAAA